jgi:hypothetical protein
LREADFAPGRWSTAAGPYLRALRERYECMRGDVLVDAALYAEPVMAPELAANVVPVESTMSFSCERHACMKFATAMAARLDHALAAPTAHRPDAPIACSQP